MSKFEFISRESANGINYSRFCMELIEGAFSFSVIDGRAPTMEEFVSGVLETVFHKIKDTKATSFRPFCKRVHNYRVTYKPGASGCKTYYIEEARNGGVVGHRILHVSMENKVNEPIKAIWLDDLMQVLLGLSYLQVEEDLNGQKYYAPCWCGYENFVQLEKRTGRNILEEEGWCHPDGQFICHYNGQRCVVPVSNKSGGKMVPSIMDGPIGAFWRDAEEAYNNFCREQAEGLVG